MKLIIKHCFFLQFSTLSLVFRLYDTCYLWVYLQSPENTVGIWVFWVPLVLVKISHKQSAQWYLKGYLGGHSGQDFSSFIQTCKV